MTRVLPWMGAALAAGAIWCGTAAAANQLLPDLEMEAPEDLQVVTNQSDGHYHLGFQSTAANVGAGPLLVNGSGPGTLGSDMVASQRVMNDDATFTDFPDIGTLRYVDSITHEHWHFLGFENYELRRVSDYALVAPDQKTGFCIGDSEHVAPTLPDTPATPEHDADTSCNPHDPTASSTSEGISVGWADIYVPQKEGQFVDLTGVPAGLYYLIHRANMSGLLKEERYDNNASSLLIQVSWPGLNQKPQVQTLKTCPDSDICPPDPPPPPPSDPGATTTSPPDSLTLPPASPVPAAIDSTFFVISTREVSTGQFRIKAKLPGPGLLTATATTAREQVAVTTTRVKHQGRVKITLTPSRRVRSLLTHRKGLKVQVQVTYTRAGAQPRTLRLHATLRRR